MNIDEMRKKYREIKQGENSNKNISEIYAGRVDESEDEQPYAKTGESSNVSFENASFDYDKETNTVIFECDHILNELDARTGQLFITLWISEKKYKFNDGGWQNDDYWCVESLDLGCLKVGYQLSNVQQTFKFSNEI